MSIVNELGLKKGFDTPGHEALLNIYHTASQIKKRADEFFRQHGLTDVQFNLLMLLHHHAGDDGGLTQVDLSRMMLVNRANITSLIDRMEKARLVVRAPVPGDRRYNQVKLTARGRDKVVDAEKGYQEKIAQLMDVLEAGEVRTLVQSLERVRASLATMDMS